MRVNTLDASTELRSLVAELWKLEPYKSHPQYEEQAAPLRRKIELLTASLKAVFIELPDEEFPDLAELVRWQVALPEEPHQRTPPDSK